MTKTYSYPAVRILQSGSAQPLVLLAAKATEIDQWAGVPQKLRVVVDEEVNTELLGFQRDEDQDRIAQIAQFYADPALAESELGWKTKRTIVDACQDSWRWQSNNPNGY